MKLYLFLRSIIWTSVLSISSAIAALIAAFIATNPALPTTLGLIAVTLAILSPRRNGYDY